MTGYSVMVKVDHLAAVTMTTAGHQEIAKAFDTGDASGRAETAKLQFGPAPESVGRFLDAW
jgi:hypothetical protein